MQIVILCVKMSSYVSKTPIHSIKGKPVSDILSLKEILPSLRYPEPNISPILDTVYCYT